jgi:hypothetical protein
MNRSIMLRSALFLIVAVPVAVLLGALGEGFALRHTLSSPGDIFWRLIHPYGSTPSAYLSGFWIPLAINSLCCLFLLALVSGGVYMFVRVIRFRLGRSS